MPGTGRRVHLARIGLDADVVDTAGGECVGEIAGSAADVEQRSAGQVCVLGGLPQIGHHRRGVLCQRAVEPGRIGLFEAELGEQPHRPRKRRPACEDVGGRHRSHPTQRRRMLPAAVDRPVDARGGERRGDGGGTRSAGLFARSTLDLMSDQPVRSVLMLCWRDTGHPQGGGSETYLQRIGAQLAAVGCRGHPAHGPLPGRTAARCRSTGCGSAAAADPIRCTSGPGWRWCWRGSASARCGMPGPTW